MPSKPSAASGGSPVSRPSKSRQHYDDVNAKVPFGPRGSREEVAEGILWLCSDAASYVTGIDLVIDGGLSA